MFRRHRLDSAEVAAKAKAAFARCRHASDHAAKRGGKPWRYVLVPHDVIADNRTLEGLAALESVPLP
jgi:type III restriction enzyme